MESCARASLLSVPILGILCPSASSSNAISGMCNSRNRTVREDERRFFLEMGDYERSCHEWDGGTQTARLPQFIAVESWIWIAAI